MSRFIALSLLLVACGGSSEAPEAKPAAAPAAPAALPDKAPAAAPAPAPDAKPDDASPEAAADAGDEGQKVYNQYCVACHQADGKGMNSTLAADFTSGRLNEKSDEELLKSISEGFTGNVGSMPAWKGVLSDDQMKAALAYVKKTYSPAK